MDTAALDRVLPALRCPVRPAALHRHERRLTCPDGHSFDLARQGYANLAVGRHHGTGDDADMVAARERFLAAGHYDVIAEQVAATIAEESTDGALLVDLAGGTGFYAARVLAADPAASGVLLDLSTPALRRAAHAHPRLAALGADAWQSLPLADGCAGTVLSVFGPRNPAEIRRVLRPGGRLVTVTPTPAHLRPLVGGLGLLGVGADKDTRLDRDFGDPVGRKRITRDLHLTHDLVRDLVGMGPSAHHLDPAAFHDGLRALPDPVRVTLSVTVAVHRP